MASNMQMPHVATEKTYGNFTFRVMAYRNLTDEEMDQRLRVYLIQNNLRRIPKTGIRIATSSLGADETGSDENADRCVQF